MKQKLTDLLLVASRAMRLKEEVGRAGFDLMASLRDFDDFSGDFNAISQEVHSYHALAETLQKSNFEQLNLLSKLAQTEEEF